jgi:6,7-dimethyl-8-ribityllumazine synthase
VVGAGLVVDGGTYRHEFVAQTVISGLLQAQIESEPPVLSALLAPHHLHGSAEHTQLFHEHFVVKGVEAARASIDTMKKSLRCAARARTCLWPSQTVELTADSHWLRNGDLMPGVEHINSGVLLR